MRRTRKTKKATSTRHSERCSICKSLARDQIETEFCAWVPQKEIVRNHGIGRGALHRHAAATGLYEKRDQNLKLVLSRFLERCGRVKPTAASFVSAVVAYSKLDERGRTVDRTENMTGNGIRPLYERMNRGELRAYAESGKLPEWFKASLPGTSFQSDGDANG